MISWRTLVLGATVFFTVSLFDTSGWEGGQTGMAGRAAELGGPTTYTSIKGTSIAARAKLCGTFTVHFLNGPLRKHALHHLLCRVPELQTQCRGWSSRSIKVKISVGSRFNQSNVPLDVELFKRLRSVKGRAAVRGLRSWGCKHFAT